MSDCDDLVASTCAATLNTSLALTGDYGNETPVAANDPGLNSTSVYSDAKGISVKKSHWLWIALLAVAVIFGLYYFGFFGGTSTVA